MELPDWEPERADAPMMRTLRDRWVTIRKPQRCTSCRHEFEAGEQLRSRAYNFDGTLHSEYLCMRCNAATPGSREGINPDDSDDWRNRLGPVL